MHVYSQAHFVQARCCASKVVYVGMKVVSGK